MLRSYRAYIPARLGEALRAISDKMNTNDWLRYFGTETLKGDIA